MVVKYISVLVCAALSGAVSSNEKIAISKLSVATVELSKERYAESVYRRFSEFSEEKLNFEVNPIHTARLDSILEKNVFEVIERPSFTIEFDQNRNSLRGQRLAPADPRLQNVINVKIYRLLDQSKDRDLGGSYRILRIFTNIGGKPLSYTALEVCDSVSKNCRIFDPVILSLESAVSSARLLSSNAWNPLNEPTEATPKARTCVLASNLKTSRLITQDDEGFTHRSLGVIGARGTLGGWDATLRCSSSADSGCTLSVAGSMSGSSAKGYWGFTTKCDTEAPDFDTYGADESKLAAAFATGCAVRYENSARLAYSISGNDDSLEYKVSTLSGQLYEHRKVYLDRCIRN